MWGTLPQNNSQIYWFLKDVYDKEYNGYDPQVWKIKELLNYSYPDRENTLLLTYKILKFHELRGEKVFTLIPNRTSFTTDYIKISNISLYNTLVQTGNLKGINRKDFLSSKDSYWRKLFHIEKYETRNRKFHFEILTNGKAVSILQSKVKETTEKKEKKIDVNDYSTVWGLDPGRKDLFAATNQEGDTIKCSSREYYHDAKFTYCKNKINKWYESNDSIKNILQDLPSIKTTDIHKIGEFLKFMFQNLDIMLDFHRDKGFRNIKF